MQFTINHNNFNVTDLKRSLDFYQQALGLKEIRRITAPDGSFILVFIGDGKSSHQIELTWLKDHPQPYDLGENEIHLALVTDDFAAAKAKHQQMGCICFENTAMGIYFIEDPDGYWLEILPPRA